MSNRILILALLGASALLVTPAVHAQEQSGELDAQQLNIARALFEEGLAFMDDKDWAPAADRFARVLQMRWSPVVAYNLGSALMELGKIGEAVEHLRRVMREPDLEESVRAPAQLLLTQGEARLGKIRIMIVGESDGLQILLDDSEWPQAAMGVAVPLAPGRHRVVLQQGTEEVEVREIFVTEREQLDVTFDRTPEEQPVVAAPAPAAVAAAAPSSGAASSSSYSDLSASDDSADDRGGSILGAWWLWTGIGVAVAAAVVTVVVVSAADPAPAMAIEGNFMPGVIEGKVQ